MWICLGIAVTFLAFCTAAMICRSRLFKQEEAAAGQIDTQLPQYTLRTEQGQTERDAPQDNGIRPDGYGNEVVCDVNKQEIDPFGTAVNYKGKGMDLENLETFGGRPRSGATTGEKFFKGVEMADLKKEIDIFEDGSDTVRNMETGRNMLDTGTGRRKSRPGQFETPTRSQNTDGISEDTASENKRTVGGDLESEQDRGQPRRIRKKKKKKTTRSD